MTISRSDQYIGIPEIARLLGISEGHVSHLYIDVNSTMPRQLIKQGKRVYYDREEMLAWIAKRLQGHPQGLDNSLAKAFLTTAKK